MQFNKRQKDIIEIVKEAQPISSQEIANKLDLSRTAIRSDLSVLVKLDILEAKPKVGYTLNKLERKISGLEKVYDLPVTEIMDPPICVSEDESIYATIVKLFMEDVGTIFIIDENKKLTGIISRKDLLKMSMGGTEIKNTPVNLAMTRMPHLFTIDATATFMEAIQKIVKNEIDSLPVIDEQQEVIGRISKTIIIRNIIKDH